MAPLLTVASLVKRHHRWRSVGGGATTTVLEDISFSLADGETVAIAGASGSGKSTLALCLACLELPTAGSISFEGRELAALSERELRAVRPRIQLVFQDPASSLNPRLSALEAVTEPLVVQGMSSAAERSGRARQLFERVGLSFRMASRAVAALSGGQRQRLAIARALTLKPRVLLLDEALSALDASVQAQVANLLLDLQQSEGYACVFITHDLAMAARVASRILVLDRGRIVEQGPLNSVLEKRAHPATQALIAATPRWEVPSSGQGNR